MLQAICPRALGTGEGAEAPGHNLSGVLWVQLSEGLRAQKLGVRWCQDLTCGCYALQGRRLDA